MVIYSAFFLASKTDCFSMCIGTGMCVMVQVPLQGVAEVIRIYISVMPLLFKNRTIARTLPNCKKYGKRSEAFFT